MSFCHKNEFNRNLALTMLATPVIWDIIIIGGGATGLGVAVDSAGRGFKTLLLEKEDFAKGTSSRSTKLVHGGVRYLAQGKIGLVFSALRERGILYKNAPHIVKKQEFIIPCYSKIQKWKYLAGLKIYDWLSGKWSFGRSEWIKKEMVIELLPGIKEKNLIGGVRYFDGQFDDSRLAINLARTCVNLGGVVINYCKLTNFKKLKGKISEVEVVDSTTGRCYHLKTRSVINATGVFADSILKLDCNQAKSKIRCSQGIHLVFNKSFLPKQSALMIPETTDGRVLFAVPWKGFVLVGTTDTLIETQLSEPVAFNHEIDFILKTIANYFKKVPEKKDILSVFAGLRPLVAPKTENKNTKEISRGMKVLVSPSGLITVIGGKWTTYRQMAEITVNKAIKISGLEKRKSITKSLPIHGYIQNIDKNNNSVFGSDEKEILNLIEENPDLASPIINSFPHTRAEVVWIVRNEMAITVEDVLARRTRMLFLDAQKAVQAAKEVAHIMEIELNKNSEWSRDQVENFKAVAENYIMN